MQTKTIKINDKQVKLQTLPLGRYADLLSALDELPEELANLDSLSEEKIITLLPRLISKSSGQIFKVISIATGLETKYLKEQVSLKDAVKLVKGVFEVNDFLEIREMLKNKAPKPTLKKK